MSKIVVIGCGGIFTQMMIPLTQYNKFKVKLPMLLVDGDEYEKKNSERQLFVDFNNKAKTSAEFLSNMFKLDNIKHIQHFLTVSNISSIINNDDIVLLCVDNHKTRKLVDDHAKELRNVTVISGGNDYYDGNVMVFVRKDNVSFGKTFSQLHKEINNPTDKNPDEYSCTDLAVSSSPQFVVTNLNAGVIMLNELFNIIENKWFHNETYFDIRANKVVAGKVINIKGEEKWKFVDTVGLLSLTIMMIVLTVIIH